MAINIAVLKSAIHSSIEGKKIEFTQTIAVPSGDGKSTVLTTQINKGLPEGDDAWKAITDSIIDELIKHLMTNMEITGGIFNLVGGVISPTLTGATVSGGPASAIGGPNTQTGTVNISMGAVK